MLKLALFMLAAALPARADFLVVRDHLGAIVPLTGGGGGLFLAPPAGTQGEFTTYFNETAIAFPDGIFMAEYVLVTGTRAGYNISVSRFGPGVQPCSPGLFTPESIVSCHGIEGISPIRLFTLEFENLEPGHGQGPMFDLFLEPTPEVSSILMMLSVALPVAWLLRRRPVLDPVASTPYPSSTQRRNRSR